MKSTSVQCILGINTADLWSSQMGYEHSIVQAAWRPGNTPDRSEILKSINLKAGL